VSVNLFCHVSSIYCKICSHDLLQTVVIIKDKIVSSLYKYQSLVLLVNDLLLLCLNKLTDDDFYEVIHVESFKLDLVSHFVEARSLRLITHLPKFP